MQIGYIAAGALLLGALVKASGQTGPSITEEPCSRSALVGSSVLLSVQASGDGPLSYQWQFNKTNLPDGVITTVAGCGQRGFSGDGGAATSARLYYPSDVALDGSGNLLIADYFNSRIRQVTLDGIIRTVAGVGTNANFGDGGPATNATLHGAFSVALDAAGNMFITDLWANRVRKVTTDGIIRTVAGKTARGYSGDGGPATNALLYSPSWVAVDAMGTLWIADTSNNRVREVDTNGTITTGAGSGTNGYYGDGGPATNANLAYPLGVVPDGLGNLFISDWDNNRVRKVDVNGIITTVAGNGNYIHSGDGGPATNAAMDPGALALDASGNLFITDAGNNDIRKVSTDGIIRTVAGHGTSLGDGGSATNASLNCPAGLKVDPYGNLFFADEYNYRIRKITNTRGPALLLNNASLTNMGDYQVVVTGPGGSVTSKVATVVVVLPPRHLSVTMKPGQGPRFKLEGTPGYPYALLVTESLVNPVNWQPIVTNVADPNGSWSYTYTNTMPDCVFYRAMVSIP